MRKLIIRFALTIFIIAVLFVFATFIWGTDFLTLSLLTYTAAPILGKFTPILSL